MGAKEEFFKEELAGSIKKRIFKAELKGESMVVSPQMKLVIPLQKLNSSRDLANKIHDFAQFEWSHTRMQNGTLCYAGFPALEIITDQTFYLWDDWRIYHRQRHMMKGCGWIEMNGRHEIQNVFCYFVPLGMYDKGDHFEITRKDKTVEKIPLPKYEENGKKDNGFLVETTNATGIYYCYGPKRASLPKVLGFDIQKISQQGNVIRFPTQYG